MKKLLGNIIIFFTLLQANEGYKVDVNYSHKEIYANQTINFDITCEFNGSGDDLDFIFTPPNIKNVHFTLLQDTQEFKNSQRIIHQYYLVEFTKAGNYNISLQAIMEKINNEQLRDRSTGRDLGTNAVNLQYEKEKINLPPLKIKVLKSAPLTGEFTLSATVNKRLLDAYEPTQLKISIRGTANEKALKEYELNIKNATIFKDLAERSFTPNKNGYHATLVQKYAISSDKNFTIAPFTLEYFDTKEKKIKTLQTKSIDIEVLAYKKENLLDSVNFPVPTKDINWNQYLNYAFYYVLGVLSVILFIYVRKINLHRNPMSIIIKNTNNPKELLSLLLSMQNDSINRCIKDLEDAIYSKKNVNLSDIKQRIIKRLG